MYTLVFDGDPRKPAIMLPANLIEVSRSLGKFVVLKYSGGSLATSDNEIEDCREPRREVLIKS
jgi:hypothetical protein